MRLPTSGQAQAEWGEEVLSPGGMIRMQEEPSQCRLEFCGEPQNFRERGGGMKGESSLVFSEQQAEHTGTLNNATLLFHSQMATGQAQAMPSSRTRNGSRSPLDL